MDASSGEVSKRTVRIRWNPLFQRLQWRRLVGTGAELLPYLRPVRHELVLAFLCSLGVVLTQIARPWPIKMVFDYALTPAGKIKWVFPFYLLKGYGAMGIVSISCGLLFLVTLLWGLFVYNQRYLVATAGQEVVFALRRRLFAHLQRLSLSYHRRHHVGDLLLRATGDTNMMREMLVDATLVVATEFLVLFAMVAVMFWMDWQLTLVSLSVLPMLALSVFHISTELRGAVRSQRRKEGRMASRFGEMLQSVPVIQAFGRERYENERFEGPNRQSLRQARRTVRLEAALERTAEILIATGTGAVLWFGVRRVLQGILTPGDLLVFVSYLGGTYRPLRRIAFVATRVSKALSCAERVFAVLHADDRVRVRRDARPAPRFRGRVSFKDVSFAYEPGRLVLDRVSFTVQPGQTLAIVGPNGSGKSTLCALLPRLYDPTEGVITIDGEKNHALPSRHGPGTDRRGFARAAAFRRNRAREHRLRKARGFGRRNRSSRPSRRRPRLHREPARGVRYAGGRARRDALRGPASENRDCAGDPERSRHSRPGRTHHVPGRDLGGAGQRDSRTPFLRKDHASHRAPSRGGA
ncbi:MAG: hypothetical protein KatS3mg076_0855 [Candidatus Binatia bacterium]|nr:MAG: hypothetical protein KatS3mg076_0855 [Candidatus Binatia bacterium]